jgi:hypothetical protein
MLYSPILSPLFHGAVGILDELLLFCLPLVVAVIILAIASRRARKNATPRERVRPTPEASSPAEKFQGTKQL